jgi:hypothetical protein
MDLLVRPPTTTDLPRRRGGYRGGRRAAATVVASAMALTACVSAPKTTMSSNATTGGDAHHPPLVALFGDSLASEAEPYFNWLIEGSRKAVVADFTFGGTAACDWLPKMQHVAVTLRPEVAVLEFVGNTFTACMRSCQPESETAVERYCSAISSAIAIFSRVHTHVYLVGTPIDREQWEGHDPRASALDRAFESLATQRRREVTYIDAGRAVEGPNGSYTLTMRCLFFEPCTGPVVDGERTNIVRSPDGVHFCPVENGGPLGQIGQCPVYSSGAFRFAAAMASPILRSLGSRHP